MGWFLMLTALFLVFADTPVPTTPPTTATTGQGGLAESLYMYAPLLLGGVALYFLMIRPMQKDRKQRESLLNQMKKNDDVLLTSGIYGTIVLVAEDKDEITVKVADNTRIRVIKSAIARNISNEEALKAQQGKPAETPPAPPK